MPNFFGPTDNPDILCPLIDPKKMRAARERFHREKIDDLDRANSLYVPCGRFPARGWILLRRADYDNLSPYDSDFTIQLDDGNDLTPPVTLQGLAIVQARCVSRGLATDPNAVYLVEITDQRGILYNRWFQYPTSPSDGTYAVGSVLAYNIRAPAYPGQFLQSTIPSTTTPWTWTGMIGDLWGQMATFLGAYPGLPFAPTGTPEGWWFQGMSAWEALNDVLDYLGCTIAVDLQSMTPYTVVQIGAADAIFTAMSATYNPIMEDDFEWLDTGAGRVPGSVVVFFHGRNEFYGTEETVRRDGLQWLAGPALPITATSPPPYDAAPGTHYLWADFTVQYDVNGDPLAADVTTANAIAVERVTQYFNRITRGQGYLNQLYAGVVPFVVGSQLDGVCWRMTRTGEPDGRRGFVTEIVRGPSPAWPELWVETGN